jgi:hypothetical protein
VDKPSRRAASAMKKSGSSLSVNCRNWSANGAVTCRFIVCLRLMMKTIHRIEQRYSFELPWTFTGRKQADLLCPVSDKAAKIIFSRPCRTMREFNAEAFLQKAAADHASERIKNKQVIFSQSEPADTVFLYPKWKSPRFLTMEKKPRWR